MLNRIMLLNSKLFSFFLLRESFDCDYKIILMTLDMRIKGALKKIELK